MKNIKIKAVKDGETFTIAGMEFIKFPEAYGNVPAVMKDIAFMSQFGDNNDLRRSEVLKKMERDILPRIIEAIGSENLCTIRTDLTALDGLNPYGTMESLISLPTFDFYRANVSIFDKHPVKHWCWLATPESVNPHDAPLWVACVAPSGYVGRDCSFINCGVRPFLRFNSSIFESSED